MFVEGIFVIAIIGVTVGEGDVGEVFVIHRGKKLMKEEVLVCGVF